MCTKKKWHIKVFLTLTLLSLLEKDKKILKVEQINIQKSLELVACCHCLSENLLNKITDIATKNSNSGANHNA